MGYRALHSKNQNIAGGTVTILQPGPNFRPRALPLAHPNYKVRHTQ
jgi:hypothetical protein